MEQERLYPEATGELSNLLYDLCLAAKIISRNVRRAGLTDILGGSGTVNVSGDLQQKLDMFANETVRNSVQHTGRVCIMASEEDDHAVPVPADKAGGKYVLLYDLLNSQARDAQERSGAGARLSAARPQTGRGRLHPVRVEHDARLHDGSGR